jgi:UDP-2,3-diacylglucosamine pyrophosphatase LpxH
VRTVFVSDIHLGCRHSQAAAFLDFLESVEPRQLYLVGDFIDGWKLRRRWRWDPVYSRILLRLSEMANGGTRLFFTPGNHDDFLREPILREVVSRGLVRIRDEFVHSLADGRRFLVLHGDRFDTVECGAKWLSVVATIAYDGLLTANSIFNRIGRAFSRRNRCESGGRPFALGAAVKRGVKRIVTYISRFEDRLIGHAAAQKCVGIICGHIHSPALVQRDGVMYCNTGDWVENCTALVEHESGRLELFAYRPQADDSSWQPLASAPEQNGIVPLHIAATHNSAAAHDRPSAAEWPGPTANPDWPDCGIPNSSGELPRTIPK